MRVILSVVFICICSALLSQDSITTKVIFFDEEDMSNYDSKSNEGLKKNTIKFNPLLILNGEIPVYYERALTESFTAEVGIGMTFKNYMKNFWQQAIDESYEDFRYEEKEEKTNSHHTFKLGARYYTGGVALDGFYFALEYANRKYSTDLTLTNSKSTLGGFNRQDVTESFTVSDHFSEFKIIAGSQTFNYWDNFFADSYFGIGIRQNNATVLTSDDDSNGNIVYQLKKESSSAPSFYLGFKVGFEF